MVKSKKRTFLIAAGILAVLIVIMVITIGDKKEKNVEKTKNIAVYVDNYAVTEDEYLMLAKEHSNQVYLQYTTEQVNSENFWEEEINGIAPYTVLEDIISEELKKNYALKSLAVEMGVVEEYTYEELVESMEEANSTDEELNYGLSSYDMPSYYKYWYSNLETNIISTLIEEKINITEEECKIYYEENKELYSYDTAVTVLYAEVAADADDAWNKANHLSKAMEIDAHVEEVFSDIEIKELELNSFNTQEGLSGIYSQRWEIASGMKIGEVYGPYEDKDVYCVIKCINREENGIVDFDESAAQIERYLQVQEANKLIDEKKESMEIKKVDNFLKNNFEKIKKGG